MAEAGRTDVSMWVLSGRNDDGDVITKTRISVEDVNPGVRSYVAAEASKAAGIVADAHSQLLLGESVSKRLLLNDRRG